MVDSLSRNTIKTPPRVQVDLFDAYATNFDQSLVGKLGYKITKLLTRLVLNESGNDSLGAILDLGCCTGLSRLEIREFCNNLEGNDLSSKMIAVALTKDVYDKLDQVDIV